MRYVAVCQNDFLFQLFQGSPTPATPPLFLVGDARVRGQLSRRGAQALSGHLDAPALYQRARLSPGDLVLLMPGRRPPEKILEAIFRVAPGVPVLLIHEAGDPPVWNGRFDTVTTLTMPQLFREVLQPEIHRAALRLKVERVRTLLEAPERVLIMMQDDPDPDAIASALALRTLIGRNKATAPIGTFGAITRPENVAMLKALEIEVERILPAAVREFDALAMVDAQPPFFEEPLHDVAVVIDHHPEAKGFKAAFRDIRPGYGATSTILTEYLRAAEIKISQKLATALFYGIKSDTLHLERGGGRADMEAFAFLFELANHNVLRRIERPELPLEALDSLVQGLSQREITRGVLFTHLGSVARPDLIPQFADLCLQVEGIEWSVVSGVVGVDLHISVRNVGYVKSAGEVVKAAFGDLGSAGGHRSMAKAVIPLRDWKARAGETDPVAIRREIVARVLRGLEV